MHSCFLLPELTLHIVSFLADDRSTSTSSSSRYLTNARDVARLARTCKALSEPALDVLWNTQHSLAPLVMCLPQDVWYLGGSGRKTIVSTHAHADSYAPSDVHPARATFPLSLFDQHLTRDVTPHDWALTTKYTHRIRAISHPKSFALPQLHDTVLRALLAPSTFSMLFPALRTLDYTVISVSASVVSLLADVLSSEPRLEWAVPLRSLSVAFPRDSEHEEVYELFEAIRGKARSLESLRIDSFAYSLPQPLEMNFSEGDLRYLKKLELSCNIRVSEESLEWVARMGYLQELSLSMPGDVDVDFLASGSSSRSCDRGRMFPALKYLKVNAYTLNQCTTLLSLVTSPSLGSISFSYDLQAPYTLLDAFFRQVQRTCGNTITGPSSSSRPPPWPSHSISLFLKHNLGPFSSPSPPFLIRPSQSLSPLLALPHLRALRLLHLGTVAMDDTFLREAGEAWGECLEELEERGVPWVEGNEWEGMERVEGMEGRGRQCVTLGGVGAFVRRCRRLERLRVAFDGRNVPGERDGVADLDAGADTRNGIVHVDANASSDTAAHANDPRCSRSLPVSPLQVLNVRDSPIDDPEGVANFLRRVAPALKLIRVEGCMETSRRWREVEDRMALVDSR
ncbi:hypothetical protein BU15DRAFT_77074 [Melanogaster broomeanus]|nr:hypothetical protein BU15DRAFT_77074 [Melanogaster broomeanus]